MLDQPPRAVVEKQPQRLVKAPAVQVRIEIAEARGQAASHLAIGRWVLTARQLSAAVAEPEDRVELLHQLTCERLPAQRANRYRATGRRLRRDFEDRKWDVQAAADVDQPIVLANEPNVAGRCQLLDQAVLEYQCPQL